MLMQELGCSTAEIYFDVAERLGLRVEQFSLLLRNPPGFALPFFHLRAADDLVLRRSAAPGSVLVVELVARDTSHLPPENVASDTLAEGPQQVASTDGIVGNNLVGSPLEAQERRSTPCERLEAERGLTGLSNMGNTCYLNSAFQCLSQTGPLREVFQDSRSTGRVASATAGALHSLWSPLDSQALVPRELKAAVVERTRTFEGNGQQDAQELLQALLEGLHEDLKRQTAGVGLAASPSDIGDSGRALAMWQQAQEGDASPVSDLFQGQLRSDVRCSECGHSEVGFELFWSLPLSVPSQPSSGEGPIPLDEVMEAFCAKEQLDEAWKCEQCGLPMPGTRHLHLWRLPRVLQLHLKRFRWQQPAASRANPQAEPKRPAKCEPKEGLEGAPATATAVAQVAQELCEDGVSSTTASVVDSGVGASRRDSRVAALEPVTKDGAALPQATTGNLQEEKPTEEAVVIPVASAPYSIAEAVCWENQERMYVLVLQLLLKIKNEPAESKFRSVGKASSKMQRELLGLTGGPELLVWAGFREIGERFDASALTAAEAESRHTELKAHAEKEHLRHLRRVRDERIELERKRRLPTGDSMPIRRWGGRLPSFGRGVAAMYGLECTKVETCVRLSADPGRPRGLATLRLESWLGEGAPERASSEYELYAVVQHLGSSPFSGHYVAVCWHEASGAWWRFNDSHVTRVSPERVLGEVLSNGAYVLFLERAT